MSSRLLIGLSVAVAAAHLIVTVAFPGSPATGWLINAAFVGGAVLSLWRATSSRTDRGAWVCIGIGLLCQAFGDRYFKSFLADSAYVSQPSVADFGYLAFYPLAGAAIILLLRARLHSLSRALVLDAAVGALAVLAVVAAIVFPDVLVISGGNLEQVVTNIAYPIADLVLLGLLVGGMQMLRGRGDRGLLLIAVALSLFVFADILYLYWSATGTYEVGGPLDACWSFAAVAMGVASWQSAPGRRRRTSASTSRAVILVVAATLAAIAVQLFDHYHRTTPPALLLATATIVAALARLVVALTDQQSATNALAETDATLRNVTETIDEVFWVTSVDDGSLLYVNPKYEQLYGRPVSQLYERPLSWIDAVHPDDRERVRSTLATIEESGELRQDFRIVRPDGEVRSVRAHTYVIPPSREVGTRMVGTFSDVTVEQEARDLLAASENRYRDLALHDPLTGLANRELFNDRLAQLLARRAPGAATTIIMVDLDGFKGVNDTLGHAAGDELLVEVARRLLECTRPEDTVARLGGDEFCALVTCDQGDGPQRCGERVVAALGEPYELGGRVVHSAASVGVAMQTPPRDSAEALMLRADVALYEAKGAGGGRCVVYDEVMEASTHLRRGPARRSRTLAAP